MSHYDVEQFYWNLKSVPDDAQRMGWRSREVQQTNFATMVQSLSSLGVSIAQGTVHDAGCGSGAFLDYLQSARKAPTGYVGTDLMQHAVEEASKRHPDESFRRLNLLRCPPTSIPLADVTVCFGALAFHKPRAVEELLARLWRGSRHALGFITWWDLTPDYLYFEHVDALQKVVRRFLKEAKPRLQLERIGDYGTPNEAMFILAR